MQTLRDAARAVLTGNNKNKTQHNNNNNNNNNNKKLWYAGLSQETRKIPNTKSNSTPKGTRSRTAKTPQSEQKKKNNKDQSRNKQYGV